VQRKTADPLQQLRAFVNRFCANGGRVAVLADSAGRRETIAQMLREYELPFGDNADFAGFVAGRLRRSPSASRRCTAASRCRRHG
jgi:transcription-repair coupling factor (superfamily II helicase)